VARPYADLAALLPAELRAALSRRELKLATRVRGMTHGVHRSRRVAAGDEFLDHRAYVPGDDLRRLDWRAAARRDRWVLRRTHAAGNHDLCLLIDDGPGMAYGDAGSKFEAARAAAAGLAWIAARNHDRVGFAFRSGRDEDLTVGPSSRGENLRRLADQLRAGPASESPDCLELVERAQRALQKPSIVVLLSDWLEPFDPDSPPGREERCWERFAQMAASGHLVVLLQLLHGDELTFPWGSDEVLRFVDPNGRRPAREGAGDALRQSYLERLQAYLEQLQAKCEAAGVIRLLARSDESLVPSLALLLDGLASGAVVQDRQAAEASPR
jgi:uncharacterized protein (DUF58 family)